MTLVYDHTICDNLPILGVGLKYLDAKSGEKAPHGDINKLFSRHADVCEKFGLQLLQHHFTMDPDEILVETRVVPCSRPLSKSDEEELKPEPYEFAFLNAGKTLSTPADDFEFVKQFSETLKNHGLNDMGLIALPPGYNPGENNVKFFRFEKALGRANVIFFLTADILLGEHSRLAVWAFTSGSKTAGTAGHYLFQ
ncbi:uncharacterized protein BCR38DRAFT_482756 [Pseudomassariella vexata]|uniref:Uncharacterized protein n=1 Tax=Pseudomassariella vexata TaxID=1141098 RepID=A0A1Y2E6H9_9PEZI|nr:uncharacterized protein BCR38DRAFT_482756 [Pseudomassariella vexata]ORY67119.1 hypothetical protein BCR38DRAFT_482756 [Pseudomassariella vexata]